jgi:hypothetical protein
VAPDTQSFQFPKRSRSRSLASLALSLAHPALAQPVAGPSASQASRLVLWCWTGIWAGGGLCLIYQRYQSSARILSAAHAVTERRLDADIVSISALCLSRLYSLTGQCDVSRKAWGPKLNRKRKPSLMRHMQRKKHHPHRSLGGSPGPKFQNGFRFFKSRFPAALGVARELSGLAPLSPSPERQSLSLSLPLSNLSTSHCKNYKLYPIPVALILLINYPA